MNKKYVLLVVVMLLACFLMGCGADSGNPSASNYSKGSSNSTSSTAVAPKIEDVEAFRKEETTLKESDIIAISIRNVEYDEKNETFAEALTVFVDGQSKTYHDVRIIGQNYYQLTVDLPSDVKQGNVYITYGESKSNTFDYAFK